MRVLIRPFLSGAAIEFVKPSSKSTLTASAMAEEFRAAKVRMLSSPMMMATVNLLNKNSISLSLAIKKLNKLMTQLRMIIISITVTVTTSQQRLNSNMHTYVRT